MNKETEEMQIDVRNALTYALMDEKLQYIPDFDKPITEYLQKQGYGKVEDHKKESVWHKVADGDLPNDAAYVVVVGRFGTTFCASYDSEIKRFFVHASIGYPLKDIIAWTELPKYEE